MASGKGPVAPKVANPKQVQAERKAINDAAAAANTGNSRAGPGQANRGFDFESRDAQGNIEGAKKGVPYSYNARTGESSGPVPGRPSNVPREPRNISINLNESLGFSDKAQADYVKKTTVQERKNAVQSSIQSKRKSYSINLSEGLSVSEGPPTGIGSIGSSKPQKINLKPTASPMPYVPLIEPSFKLGSSPKIKLVPPVMPKLISKGTSRYMFGPQGPKNNKINLGFTPSKESQKIEKSEYGILQQEKTIFVPAKTILRNSFNMPSNAAAAILPYTLASAYQDTSQFNKDEKKAYDKIIKNQNKFELSLNESLNVSDTSKKPLQGPNLKEDVFFVGSNTQIFSMNGTNKSSEKMELGPYVETQQQADQINKNAEIFRDDQERNKIYTVSKLTKDLGLDKKTFFKNTAKSFDETFELNKLPKERNSINTPIFGSNFITLPSNRKMADVLAPITNIGADLSDLGNAALKGVEGFEPSEGALFGIGKGLPVPKQFNAKFEEKPESYGTTISLIGASFSGGLSPFAKEISPKGTNIFKNFRSETIKSSKGGGSDSGQYITIKVDKPFRPGPSIKETFQNFKNKFGKPTSSKSNLPILAKPSDIAPMYNVVKPDYSQWSIKGISKPNKFQGIDSIALAKNMKTGERLALAGRTKNKFLNVKEIKNLKINPPEEFIQGKDGNIDVKTFFKGHLRFDRTQKSGFEEIKMTDQRTGISKTRTSINMNMGKPSIGWIVPRGKPKTSLNDIFATQKDAQVKDFKKFITVKKIEENEEIFKSTGLGTNNKPGLLYKQKQEQKIKKVELKNELKSEQSSIENVFVKQNKKFITNPKQSNVFKSSQISLGSSSVFIVPRQKKSNTVSIIQTQPQKRKTKKVQWLEQPVFVIPAQTQPQTQPTSDIAIVGQPWPQPQTFPFPPGTRNTPKEIPPAERFGFPPYVPGAYFGSDLFENQGSVKKSFAAYGISSDINIKTLPTYSRYSSGTGIFKAQSNEDKRIQNLFYGKPRKKSKSKNKSSSKKRHRKR